MNPLVDLISPFINQMEQVDDLNPGPHHLFLCWGDHHNTLYPTSRPLVATRQRHLLTSNWVFIRLPARERCSEFIWHNYREKMESDAASGYWHSTGKGRQAGWNCWGRCFGFFLIRHLVWAILDKIECKWSNCLNTTNHPMTLLWYQMNKRWCYCAVVMSCPYLVSSRCCFQRLFSFW